MQKLVVYVIGILLIFSGCNTPSIYNKIHLNNHRYSTFELAFWLLDKRQAKVIVETGTSRDGDKNCCGDGCSTLLFAEWAKNNKAKVFSVDICPQSIAGAKKAVEPINPEVAFFTMDSITFLEQFDQTIDFLYLDSYDFDSKNPLPSQEHHLKEIIAAYPHLGDHSVVMIDDCGLPHGGKGKLAIEWLEQKGWIVLASQYQSILIKG
jgi:SAM-dependent methyltransferase